MPRAHAPRRDALRNTGIPACAAGRGGVIPALGAVTVGILAKHLPNKSPSLQGRTTSHCPSLNAVPLSSTDIGPNGTRPKNPRNPLALRLPADNLPVPFYGKNLLD